MNIDYVIISSDDSHYLDFYETTSKMWNHFGIKTLMLHITDSDSEFIKNEFGLYKKLKASPLYPTSWQAQLVRLYAYEYFLDYCLLMSDIDMIPINGEFFKKNALNFEENQILSYSNQPYDDVPYFPICYILGNSKIMKKQLNLPKSFYEFLENVKKDYTIKWNSDEHYLYDHLIKYNNLTSLPIRDYKLDRIDRSNWIYNIDKVVQKKYIDSHMPRPYKHYAKEINKLTELILGA